MVQIVVQVVRSKFIAILLGPMGMGIASLLNSTTSLIEGITNFGLETSAVKDVAEADGSGNSHRVSTIIVVLKRLVWITGLLGTVLTLILSKWLSKITFGNTEYTLAFVWISMTLLFKQISTGQLVLLQGLRKIQYLAKANLSGSILGLIITVPLYYFYGIDAIVPGIIITSLISLALSWYFSKKIEIKKVIVSPEQTFAQGKNMLTMGFMLSLSGLITLGSAYIVRIYINNKGGLNEVGLYNAGFAIINTYVGMIFTAMATDYYPRLSAIAHSNKLSREIINQQAEIALLILSPILIAFLVFVKWIVVVLYSTKFVDVDVMIHWAAFGMFFKAASWSIAFILLAKSASKLFFINELIANSYTLGLNILGYYYWGLSGLGISFMLGYVLYLIQIFIVSKIKYDFTFNRSLIRIFLNQFALASACFILIKVASKPYSYLIGILLIAASSWHSYRCLDERIGIRELVSDMKNRFIKE